jgi:hypothetical protein
MAIFAALVVTFTWYSPCTFAALAAVLGERGEPVYLS